MKYRQVGNYNNLPHYNIIGEPTAFYVWVNEDGKGTASNWITGREAFRIWHKLRAIKKKNEFIREIKKLQEK